MVGQDLEFEPLGQHHDRAAFSCGVEPLDAYLRSQASQDMRRRIAAVFVLHDHRSRAIVGYYTLSALQIDPTALPETLAKKLPRRPLPATLLGRFAVDARYQKRGRGELLLLDALNRAERQSEQVGSMAVVVDAKDENARSFYERYQFRRFVDSEFRLFLPMTVIRSL